MYCRLLYLLLFFLTVSRLSAIRCQCSTQKGAVPCYNNWCEVHNRDGKEAACAFVQTPAQRQFACVRVKKDSGDECKVDRVNGQLQVRCWCKTSDYCNIEMAERVEEEHDNVTSAEEIHTTPATRIVPSIPRDDFIIDNAYEEDNQLTNVVYDDEGIDIEDDFPHEHPLPPVLLTFPPHTRNTNDGLTIPPWRREVPASAEGGHAQTAPPLRIPERPERRPAETEKKWPARILETTTEKPTTKKVVHGQEQRRIEEERRRIEYEQRRKEWEERERQRLINERIQNERRIPARQGPVPPPSSSMTTSTTTTTTRKPITTTSTTTTTTTTPTTTTTTLEEEKIRGWWSEEEEEKKSEITISSSTTTTSTRSTTPRTTSTTTSSILDAFVRLRQNQEDAKTQYQKFKQRYRPFDFLATKSTTSTTTTTETPTTTETTTTRTTITIRRRTTTTPSTTTSSTTTTTRTTTEIEDRGEKQEVTTTVEPFIKKYLDKKRPSSASFFNLFITILLLILFL